MRRISIKPTTVTYSAMNQDSPAYQALTPTVNPKKKAKLQYLLHGFIEEACLLHVLLRFRSHFGFKPKHLTCAVDLHSAGTLLW